MNPSKGRAQGLVLLFGGMGLASGFTFAVLDLMHHREAVLFSGAFFGVGLCMCAHFAETMGWTQARPGVAHWVFVPLLLGVTYVFAAIVTLASGKALEQVLPGTFNDPGLGGSFLLFLAAGLFSVLVVGSALAMLTGIWSRRAFVAFLVVGAFAGPLSFLLHQAVSEDRYLVPTLSFVTQVLAGLASGYWFVQVPPSSATSED